MAEVGAVAKVIRVGGEATRMLANLSAGVRSALEQLGQVNPAVGRALEAYKQLGDQMQRSDANTSKQVQRQEQLTQALRAQTAPRAAMPQAPVPPVTFGRALTQEERQRYRERYTDPELDRARMVRKGMIYVPKPGGPTEPVGVGNEAPRQASEGSIAKAPTRILPPRTPQPPVAESQTEVPARAAAAGGGAQPPEPPDSKPGKTALVPSPETRLIPPGTVLSPPQVEGNAQSGLQQAYTMPAAAPTVPRDQEPAVRPTPPTTLGTPSASPTRDQIDDQLAGLDRRRKAVERDVDAWLNRGSKRGSQAPSTAPALRAKLIAAHPDIQEIDQERTRLQGERQRLIQIPPPAPIPPKPRIEDDPTYWHRLDQQASRGDALPERRLVRRPPAQKETDARRVVRSRLESLDADTLRTEWYRNQEGRSEQRSDIETSRQRLDRLVERRSWAGRRLTPRLDRQIEQERARGEDLSLGQRGLRRDESLIRETAAMRGILLPDDVDKTSAALRRADFVKNLSVRTDRQLISNWQEQHRTLEQQQRDIADTETRYHRLTAAKEKGIAVDDREISSSAERIRDLSAARRETLSNVSAVRNEASGRGLPLPALGGSGMRGVAGAFLGGAGIGGGSIGGTVAGFALGGLSGPLALATLLGMGAGKAWSFVSRGADDYGDTQRLVFNTGLQLGGGFQSLRSRSDRLLRSPLRLRHAESLGAIRALAMQTGQTDVEGIAAFARLHGLPVEETTSMIGSMGRLGAMPVTHVTREYPAGWRDYTRRGLSEVRESLAQQTAPGTPTGHDRPIGVRYLEHELLGEFRRRRERDLGQPRYVGHGRGLEQILSDAYRSSGYNELPDDRRDALLTPFMAESARLMNTQAEGETPIADFERAPSMLGAATRLLGKNLPPEFGGRIAGGVVEGITNPQNPAARGIALRGIMDLGRSMSPEDLEKFRHATDTKNGGNVYGGIDLTSYSGAMAAMQNAFALPREQSQMIVSKVLDSYRQVTGRGTEQERLFFGGMFGGKYGPGISAERMVDDIVKARADAPEEDRGSRDGTDLSAAFLKRINAAGAEAKPFEQDARTAEAALAGGKVIKEIGEQIADAVLNMVDRLRGAQSTLREGAPSFGDVPDGMSR